MSDLKATKSYCFSERQGFTNLAEFLEKEAFFLGIDEFGNTNPKGLKITNSHLFDKEDFAITLKDLGLFFWERGGKQFVKKYHDLRKKENIVVCGLNETKYAQQILRDNRYQPFEHLFACDFLDALACLGEERVKELIKELK